MSPSFGSFIVDVVPQFRSMLFLLTNVIQGTIVDQLPKSKTFRAVLFSLSDRDVVFLHYAKLLLLCPKLG
eukprot:11969589-Heterocapsa_arctica.AAC.1